MIDTVFGYFLGLLLIGGSIAAAVNRTARMVVIILLVCVVGFKLIFSSTPTANSSQDNMSLESSVKPAPVHHYSSPTIAPSSPTITIENYRYKGDSVKIKCTGKVGHVVCGPAS